MDGALGAGAAACPARDGGLSARREPVLNTQGRAPAKLESVAVLDRLLEGALLFELLHGL